MEVFSPPAKYALVFNSNDIWTPQTIQHPTHAIWLTEIVFLPWNTGYDELLFNCSNEQENSFMGERTETKPDSMHFEFNSKQFV